jgi:transcriptional regulator with XRE-family HTH domain
MKKCRFAMQIYHGQIHKYHRRRTNMFRERILEEKKKLGISAESMSARSRMHISEETISRVLTAKTGDPGVNTVLDMGETVGLAPYEIFMDATLAAEFKTFLELKSKSKETETERIRIITENENLKTINATLSQTIEKLEMQLHHKDELLALHEHYQTHFKQLIKRGEI